MTERVDVLIDRVMKAFPGVSALAQSRYYEEVHQELAPLAREIERQRDELAARVEWMADRISYVEHSAADGTPCVKIKVGGYWPQGEHEEDNADPDMIGLTLIEYVDAQIAREAK